MNPFRFFVEKARETFTTPVMPASLFFATFDKSGKLQRVVDAIGSARKKFF